MHNKKLECNCMHILRLFYACHRLLSISCLFGACGWLSTLVLLIMMFLLHMIIGGWLGQDLGVCMRRGPAACFWWGEILRLVSQPRASIVPSRGVMVPA